LKKRNEGKNQIHLVITTKILENYKPIILIALIAESSILMLSMILMKNVALFKN